jgi:hypothetical protein
MATGIVHTFVNERDTKITLLLLPVQITNIQREKRTWIRQYPNFPLSLALQLYTNL